MKTDGCLSHKITAAEQPWCLLLSLPALPCSKKYTFLHSSQSTLLSPLLLLSYLCRSEVLGLGIFFLGPNLQHMEVPRLRVKSELQLQAMPQSQQRWLPNPLIKPASSWILVGFDTTEPQQELPLRLFEGRVMTLSKTLALLAPGQSWKRA